MPKKANRTAALLDVSSWRAIPFKEQYREIKARRRRSARQVNPKATELRPADATVRPADLYCYLKARFGMPNDLIMLTRAPGLENLVHWAFAFGSGPHAFMLHATSNRVEFVGEKLTPEEWHQLMTAIKHDFQKHGPAMSEIRAGLLSWTLFVNPFRRVQKTVLTLGAELRRLALEEPEPRPMMMTRTEADAYYSKFGLWSEEVRLAAICGTSIRMLAPVMAEAFVNFILFVFGRSDVRRDQRLYDSVVRQQIDVRVRGLHLSCEGFQGPVDTTAEPFKRFLRLMDGRNDFLHGNIDPHALAFDTLLIDDLGGQDLIPLFSDDRGVIARYLSNSLKFVEREAALDDIDIVQEFIQHTLLALGEDGRSRLAELLVQDYLGRNDATGEVAQLFHQPLGDMILGAPDGADESSRKNAGKGAGHQRPANRRRSGGKSRR